MGIDRRADPTTETTEPSIPRGETTMSEESYPLIFVRTLFYTIGSIMFTVAIAYVIHIW